MDLHRRAARLERNSCGQELYHVRNRRASAVSTSGFVSAADLTSSNRDVRFGSFATEPFRASAEQCPLCLR